MNKNKTIILSFIIIIVTVFAVYFVLLQHKKHEAYVMQMSDQLDASYVSLATPVIDKLLKDEINPSTNTFASGAVDYKINEIKFIGNNHGVTSKNADYGDMLDETVFPKDLKSAFVVSVDYSVKLKPKLSEHDMMTWIAGNGQFDEGNNWVENKFEYVRIEETDAGFKAVVIGTGL